MLDFGRSHRIFRAGLWADWAGMGLLGLDVNILLNVPVQPALLEKIITSQQFSARASPSRWEQI